jgi:hypothetical protein
MFRLGYDREVHRMSKLLVIVTEAIVNKLISAVDLTGIPSQWALGYVELRAKIAYQSHLVRKVKEETPELYFHKETNLHRLFFKGLLFDMDMSNGWGINKI